MNAPQQQAAYNSAIGSGAAFGGHGGHDVSPESYNTTNLLFGDIKGAGIFTDKELIAGPTNLGILNRLTPFSGRMAGVLFRGVELSGFSEMASQQNDENLHQTQQQQQNPQTGENQQQQNPQTGDGQHHQQKQQQNPQTGDGQHHQQKQQQNPQTGDGHGGDGNDGKKPQGLAGTGNKDQFGQPLGGLQSPPPNVPNAPLPYTDHPQHDRTPNIRKDPPPPVFEQAVGTPPPMLGASQIDGQPITPSISPMNEKDPRYQKDKNSGRSKK